MAGPLYLSNRLENMLAAGERLGQTVAANRQLKLENKRQAEQDAQTAKLRGLQISEAERQKAKAAEQDALAAELAQADTGSVMGPTQAGDFQTGLADPWSPLKDRLRAKMFTASGAPTTASDLAQKRESSAFQIQSMKNEEARKQAQHLSDIEAAKSGRFTPFVLADNTVGAFNTRTGQVASTGEKAQPKPGAATPNIPIDVKSEVTALSSKNASKVAIANQIGSYLEQFRAAKSEDDKVRIGGQMLKVLNSPEGADAVGSEEAKRLGDALEFNIFDVKAGLGAKPGKLVGRDLKGFERQAEATYNAIRGSVDQNRAEVDRLMGRQEPPNVSNDAEYDALPSGAVFIDPKGVKRRKP